MKSVSRANVVSSFTIIKGAMVEETFSALAAWDLDQTKRQNLDHIRDLNLVAAKSQTWLRDIGRVLSRRFDPAGKDRPLALLAKAAWSLDAWKPALLWHITREEFLFRDFLINWLFPAWREGVHRLRPEDLYEFLRSVPKRGGVIQRQWSEKTLRRVAVGLLGMASSFGLVRGSTVRTFASYHLPDPSFLYLLHVLHESQPNPRRLIESQEWKMFLMEPSDVERELLRLHQFRALNYEAAGTIVQLTLPFRTALDYAGSMAA
ncbi:MAG: DUF1819 family protein [Acidobacteria bacterium]|nr:DUF1819 family protein [Acidobacteriota bacterium]MCG3192300.1 hypothetical protein [Thermoanaerobaculia bacterium]